MFHKEDNKSCRHVVMHLIIALLLGAILVVLVFKVGLIAGSKYGSGSYNNKLSGHMFKKSGDWKKSLHANFKVVTEITDTGYIVKDSKGEMQTITTSSDTEVYKGEEKDGVVINVGDKVYVVGSVIEASMIKVYSDSDGKFKK